MAMKQLHPGAKWLFRITGFFSVLFLAIFLGIFISASLGSFLIVAGLGSVVSLILSFYILFVLVLLVLIEVYARLSYKFFFYEFTSDQLRVERGIIWKTYSNIPYQRIQNVDISRGIIARMLGFSTVNVHTAGYSGPAQGRGMHAEGYLPAVGVEEAERIREFVMKKISRRKGSGM